MGLLERIESERHRVQGRHPVDAGVSSAIESEWGHSQERFSPASYGDYIATSSDVFAAASLRARLMSGLQPMLYRGRGPSKTEVTSGPPVDLLRSVNPFWTWGRLQRMDELCMCLWGETVWALEPDVLGEPGEIWWLKPSRVAPVPDANDYLKGFLYQTADGEILAFEPHEIVWFRYPNPLDEFSPLSPLAAARLAADTSSAMMKSNQRMFSQGLNVGGFVRPKDGKTSFSPEQAADLERDLERRFKGADKAHRWAVLRFEAEFDRVEVSPKDAEWVNGLNITLRQTCNAYGIPSPLLNDMEHATLSNAREYERILWTHALIPDSRLRADEIEEQLLSRFRSQRRPDHVEFDFNQVAALQESATESWTRERQAIEVGALTINEWRARHGLGPVPWGDVFWAPINKAPVDSDQPPALPEGEGAANAALWATVADEVDRAVAERMDELKPTNTVREVERDQSGRVVRVVERAGANGELR